MLAPAIVDRITTSVAAYLGPRDRILQDNLRAAKNQLAARGMIGSGNAAIQLSRIGSDELTIRARITWNAIQRAHGAAGSPIDAATQRDLEQQVTHHVNGQAAQVRTATAGSYPPIGGSTRATIVERIEAAISTTAVEILAQLRVEVGYYVDQLVAQQNAQAQPMAGSVTINAHSIGAVQTGAFAVSHVNLGDGNADRLATALEALRTALQANTEATPQQKAEGDELADDLLRAVRAEQPNGPKIAGLLGGLATTVQTIASIRPAWQTVRDTALALGLMVGMGG